jgi:hypothetical protein
MSEEKPRPRQLGRGLEALFGEDRTNIAAAEEAVDAGARPAPVADPVPQAEAPPASRGQQFQQARLFQPMPQRRQRIARLIPEAPLMEPLSGSVWSRLRTLFRIRCSRAGTSPMKRSAI